MDGKQDDDPKMAALVNSVTALNGAHRPVLVAVFPRTRVLAWDGASIYASRGYELLRADVAGSNISWQSVARYKPPWWRRQTSLFPLTFRLCRDGFHALAILPSKHMVAAVPGAIVTLVPGEKGFRVTHAITRGTRPLHIAATPSGKLFWGEYFDNPQRDEVHLYASYDEGLSWNVAYTFPKGAIRHIHNVIYDKWEDCLWIWTGDNGDECRVMKADEDFSRVELVLAGNQQARAAACIPAEDGLYFSTDTPFEQNYVYRLGRNGGLSPVTKLNSSSIYGCCAGSSIFFSTMVEPSTVNVDREARLWASDDGQRWRSCLQWKKDRWPMGLFQYGNIFLPDGNNTTNLLAITTIALAGVDLQTSFWRL